MLYA
jgi:hypothetical protein